MHATLHIAIDHQAANKRDIAGADIHPRHLDDWLHLHRIAHQHRLTSGRGPQQIAVVRVTLHAFQPVGVVQILAVRGGQHIVKDIAARRALQGRMTTHQHIARRHHGDIAQIAPVYPAILTRARHPLAVDIHQRLKAGVLAGYRGNALGHGDRLAQLVGQRRLKRRFIHAVHHPGFFQLLARRVHRNGRAAIRRRHLQLRHQPVCRDIYPVFRIAPVGDGGHKGFVFADMLCGHRQRVFVKIQLAKAFFDGHVPQAGGVDLETEVIRFKHQAQFASVGFLHGQTKGRFRGVVVFTHGTQSSISRLMARSAVQLRGAG